MQAVLPVWAPVCAWRDTIRRTATVGQREDARRREGVSDEERT